MVEGLQLTEIRQKFTETVVLYKTNTYRIIFAVISKNKAKIQRCSQDPRKLLQGSLLRLWNHKILTRGVLTLSWWGSLSYRNQSTDLWSKSIDWFLYDRGLRHERVKSSQEQSTISGINPFHATGLFLNPLKTSENIWFSYVFKDYRKRPVA